MPHSVPSFRIIQIIQGSPNPASQTIEHQKNLHFLPCFVALIFIIPISQCHIILKCLPSEFPLSIFVPYIFFKNHVFSDVPMKNPSSLPNFDQDASIASGTPSTRPSSRFWRPSAPSAATKRRTRSSLVSLVVGLSLAMRAMSQKPGTLKIPKIVC